jgi:S-adenosylmethionine-dependent methyltransferase
LSRVVREYYARDPGREWGRLVRDGYHRFEFVVTMHFLDKYLPRKGLILDAGGGPGRYTVELARKGFSSTLSIWPSLVAIVPPEYSKYFSY